MAKRHGNLFQQIAAQENIEAAYARARKGRSLMRNVIKFDEHLADNIAAIRMQLLTRQFTTSRYKKKIIHEPKTREIFVLPFSPDRIVQHAITVIMAPIWDKLMIYDSYACRPGKGQHAGSRRAMEFVRKYRYCLQCDVAKFYPSIDQEILSRIVHKKIKCSGALWLLDDIIFSYPGGKNVPIGNYTSQWFGNLYLNELDQFIKNECKVRGYLRYCDDFCLFYESKAFLRDMKQRIEQFLFEKLQLRYSYAEVFPVSQGVDFLGYRHFKKKILLRRSTASRVKARLKGLPERIASAITKSRPDLH